MTDYKLPVLVINLPEKVNRWNSTINELEKISPIISKIYKIKATNENSAKEQKYNYISKKAYKNIISTESTAIMPTWGALGCAISHIFCWKYIVEKNIDHALICEDDIEIRSKDLYFDIIESYHFMKGQEKKQFVNNIILFDANTTTANYKLYNSCYNLYQINSGYIKKTHMYLLSKETAEFMLSNILPLTYQIDIHLSKKFITNYKYIFFLFNKETGLTDQKKFLSNVQYFIPTKYFITSLFKNIFDSDNAISEKIHTYLDYNFDKKINNYETEQSYNQTPYLYDINDTYGNNIYPNMLPDENN